jgi:hypothetical protein
MLDAAKEFEASGKSRNYFAQQNMLRKKTMQEIVVQRETERANVEKVNTLDQIYFFLFCRIPCISFFHHSSIFRHFITFH